MIILRHQDNITFRRILWIAVLGMLLPVFLPLFHQPARVDPSVHPSGCHMEDMAGMRNASDVDDNKNAHDKSTGKAKSCPICQTLATLHNGFITPAVISAVLLYVHASMIVREKLQIFVASRHDCFAWPRAPPIFL